MTEVPASPQNERCILGSVLLREHALVVAQSVLRGPSDFFVASHRTVWSAMLAVVKAGTTLDVVTLQTYLKEHNQLASIGGPASLLALAEAVPTANNVEHYARAVRRCAVRRRMLTHSAEARELAESPDVDAALERMQKSAALVASDSVEADSVAVGSVVSTELRRLMHEAENPSSRALGLSTGFPDLDAMIAGLRAPDLIIVAGRPGMGKTALAWQWALAVSGSGHPSAVFSLEMSKEQLAMRTLALGSGVPLQRLRQGNLKPEDWAPLNAARARVDSAPLEIVDRSRLTLSQLCTVARLLHARRPLRLIMVDYLQLLRVPGSQSREREIAEISAGLKALAKELHTPVVALSQLSRECERRPNKRPVLADLRDSGGIEQDADCIVFVYRDEYYKKTKDNEGLAELLVAKQRNGPTGLVHVGFDGEATRFGPLPQGTFFN